MRRNQCALRLCDMVLLLEDHSLKQYLTDNNDGNEAVMVGTMSDTIPAIAAALGDTDILLKHVTVSSNIFSPSCGLLPNALNAAVVFDSSQTLRVMLNYLQDNPSVTQASGPDHGTSNANYALGNALRLAIRKEKIEARNMILNFIDSSEKLLRSTSHYIVDESIKKHLKEGTPKSLFDVLCEKSDIYSSSKTLRKSKTFLIHGTDYLALYKFGRGRIFAYLLENNIIHSNAHPAGLSLRGSTSLRLALIYRRYDLALILLANGADIDGRSKTGDMNTALTYATECGHVRDVEFLLSNGASVHGRGKDMYTVYEIAEERGWYKCKRLILHH